MGRFPVLTKLNIFFLGLAVGGATFLATGLASFLTISQLQDRTLQAMATQAIEASQVSIRAKDAPLLMVDADRAELQYVRFAP
jgi:hypothetical protein